VHKEAHTCAVRPTPAFQTTPAHAHVWQLRVFDACVLDGKRQSETVAEIEGQTAAQADLPRAHMTGPASRPRACAPFKPAGCASARPGAWYASAGMHA
jgi:hypothetical protein